MNRQRRLLSILGIALMLAALGGIACSKKKSVTTPTTHGFPLSNGNWRITVNVSTVSGGTDCPALNETSTDTVVVAGGEPTGSIFPDCTFNVTGSRFTQACSDTILASDCPLFLSYSGSGSVTSTTFTATYNMVLTSSESCSQSLDCHYRVVLTGQKLASGPTYAPVGPRHPVGRLGPTWLSRLRSR